MLRNPWDTLLSYYFSAHRGGVKEWDREKFKRMVLGLPGMREFASIDDIPTKLDRILGLDIFLKKPLGQDLDLLYVKGSLEGPEQRGKIEVGSYQEFPSDREVYAQESHQASGIYFSRPMSAQGQTGCSQ